MFRNPVFDLMVIVPALLIAGLLSFFVMTSAVHASSGEDLMLDVTALDMSTSTASASGTLPDLRQRTLRVTRGSDATSSPAFDARAPRAVRTAHELEAYAYGLLTSDPAVDSITLSSQGIVVAYRSTGRLLGVLPVAVPTSATILPDGSVLFSEPWYGTMTLTERDRMKSALEVRVHSLLTSEGYLSSMHLSPATQAELLEIVHELLG